MATTSTSITFSIINSWSAKEFNITDTTTYSGPTPDVVWTSADSRGLIKIVDTFGAVYYNNIDKLNPDITVGGGSKAISIPTDGDGNIITGDYTITLTLFDVNATEVITFDAAADITAGGIDEANTYNVGEAVVYDDGGGTKVPELTDGATYYISVNTTSAKVFLSTSYANAIAGTDLTLTNAGVGAAHTLTYTAVDFERSYYLDVQYAQPKVSLTASYSAINPIYLKCVDGSNYAINSVTPTIARTWTLIYPDNNGTFTSTDASLDTGVFYGSESGAMNQISLSVTTTYSFAGYYTDATSVNVTWSLVNILSGTPKNGGIIVYTDSSGCDSYCCVKSAYEAYVNASTNSIKQDKKAIWEEAAELMTMITAAYNCNDSSAVNTYKDRLLSITKCNGNCGCDSSSVVQVVGIGTTPNVNRIYEYTATSNITTLTIPDKFKNYSYASGDFICFVDGDETRSTSGYSTSYNSGTGVFTFGTTVVTNTKITFYIIKP